VFLKHDLVDAIHVPGAGAAFRGLKVGESAELEAELPPHFEPREHAGRRAALRALVTGHRKVVVPELTQELIEKAGVKDEAELRERVRQGLEAQREQSRGEQVDRAVEAWLVQQHPLPLPERLLAKAIERRVHEVAHRLMEQQGLSSEDGHRQAEAERPRIEEAVKRSLHASFILARLAREHDLGASVAEGEEQVRNLARSQGQDPEQVVQAARREGWLQDVMATVTEAKTRAWLRQRARVEEAAPAAPVA
jgi:FKBP-type peptidyl-prolyl cis-trans isomerase (trigger factor)